MFLALELPWCKAFLHTTWELLQEMLWFWGLTLLNLPITPPVTEEEHTSLSCKVDIYLLSKRISFGSDSSQMRIVLIAKNGFLLGRRLSLLVWD